MADHIHLSGAEDVRSAANTMRDAAETINRASSNMQWMAEQLTLALQLHAERVEAALREHTEANKVTIVTQPVPKPTFEELQAWAMEKGYGSMTDNEAWEQWKREHPNYVEGGANG